MSHIFICTRPFCFAVTWCLSETSICLSVSSDDSEKNRNIWRHVTLCSRIQNPIGQLQTVTKISTSTFVIIRHMFHRCIYLLVTVIFSVFACTIKFSLKHTWFFFFSFSFGGFGNFAIRWYSDPHLKHFRGVRSVCLLSKSPAARAFSFYGLILLDSFLQSD